MNKRQWIKILKKHDIEAKKLMEKFSIIFNDSDYNTKTNYYYINYLDLYLAHINPECLHNNNVLLDFYLKYLADVLIMFICDSLGCKDSVFTIMGNSLLKRFLGLLNIRDIKMT